MENTILLVDDHPVFRRGLYHLLEKEKDLRVVGEADDGHMAVELVRRERPDIVVMDISMPNLDGIEATRRIRSEQPDVRIIALSVNAGRQFVRDMFKAGASGYILKESIPEEMIEGIRTVLAGDIYLSRSISNILVSDYKSLISEAGPPADDVAGPILYTKLHRPPISADIIPRTRLIEALESGVRCTMTLISAPAGYGKSILASQWLEISGFPGAWVSLDRNDNDLRVFLGYVLEAARSLFPEHGLKTASLLEAPRLPTARVICHSLLNELEQISIPFILVLDDYHHIHNTGIHDFLAELLVHPSPVMHLVLLTRRDPPLPLASLRAQGMLTEITTEQLRFTISETKSFLERFLHMSVADNTVRLLEEKMEGWVTGLHLAALSIKHPSDHQRLADGLQKTSQYVREYLMTEVLDAQPAEMRQSLLNTAILDRFCAPLCDAVAGAGNVSGGRAFIARLQQEKIFHIALDAENRWFRYHHLFQELLQSQLKRRYSAEEIAALHRRAGAWFAGNGFVDEAVQHAVAGGDMTGAVRLVEKHRWSVLNVDRWYVLETWLDRLPDEVKTERPEILLTMAWVAYHKFRVSEIPPLLESIEKLIDQENVHPVVLGELNLFNSFLSYFQGRGEKSLTFAQQALDQLPMEFEFGRADAIIYLGLAYQMIGQKDTAIRILNQMLQRHPRQAGLFITRLHATTAFVHLIAGELREAEQAAMRLEQAAKAGKYDYAGLWGAFVRGCCAFLANDLDAAVLNLSHVVTNRYIHHIRCAISGMVGLALTYQAMQRPDRADEVLRELAAFARETHDPKNQSIADACRARISLLRCDPAPAARWLKTFDGTSDPPSMLFFLEIPAITQNRVLIAAGSDAELKEAESRLSVLWDATQAIHNIFQMIQIGVLRAVALLAMSRIDEALAVLGHVITLSAPGGWIRPFVEAGPPMIDLLAPLQRQHASGDYIEKILAAVRENEARSVPAADDAAAVQEPSASPEPPGRDPAPVSAEVQPLIEPLTHRELDVLELLSQRFRNKEIAEKLFISPETVKGHLKNIYQKLDVSDRRRAVLKAQKLRIFPRS